MMQNESLMVRVTLLHRFRQ